MRNAIPPESGSGHLPIELLTPPPENDGTASAPENRPDRP